MYQDVFSEYEVDQMGVKFPEDTAATVSTCIGTTEETLEAKTIEKKCRGVVAKTRTKGTGNGEIKVSAHMNYDEFCAMYGMNGDDFKDGVLAYGENSRHEEFCYTQRVKDEDGNIKYKAYPRCIVKEGITRKIENGAEEVAELELTIAIMPDDYGNGMYEAVASEITDDSLKNDWMTKFTPDLVRTPGV